MSKKKKNSFLRMLKENSKKVRVMKGKEELSVQACTEESINKITCTSADGVVPVSVTEVEGAITNSNDMVIDTSYSESVWSVYESSLKSKTKQTLFICVDANKVDNVLDGNLEEIEMLENRSNIKMILDEIPGKAEKRLIKWKESEDAADNPSIFVLRIPDVILFVESIKKNEPANVTFFDFVVCFVKTKKSLPKLAKKDKQEFYRVLEKSIESSLNVLRDFGASSIHTQINEDMIYKGAVHTAASIWLKKLNAIKGSIIGKITFCTTDTDILVQFSNEIAEPSVRSDY